MNFFFAVDFQAVDGFKNLETAHNYVLPSFSISNKNNLVSFLMAVRTFLKDDEVMHCHANARKLVTVSC